MKITWQTMSAADAMALIDNDRPRVLIERPFGQFKRYRVHKDRAGVWRWRWGTLGEASVSYIDGRLASIVFKRGQTGATEGRTS